MKPSPIDVSAKAMRSSAPSAVASSIALLALAAASITRAQDAGVAPPPAWAATCVARLEAAAVELAAAGVHLPHVEVHDGPAPFGAGATVMMESDDGRLFALIETWQTGLTADTAWEETGFGECPSEEEMQQPWVLRLVRNYAAQRQAQILVRDVRPRHGPAIRRILTAALDECAAM